MKKLAGRQGGGALQRRARLVGLAAAPLLAVVIVLAVVVTDQRAARVTSLAIIVPPGAAASATSMTTAVLNIPTPLPGRLQIDPRGSVSYLAWYELAPLRPAGEQSDLSFKVRAIDLASGATLSVASGTRPCASYYGNSFLAVADALVVWQQAQSDHCDRVQLRAKDLRSGRNSTVAQNADARLAPVAAGHSVVWTAADRAQLWLDDLDTNSTTQILGPAGGNAAPAGAPQVIQMALDAQYLAWAQWVNDVSEHYQVRVYNRGTRQISTVADNMAPRQPFTIAVALDGTRLAWTDPALHLLDLAGGAVRQIYDEPLLNPLLVGPMIVGAGRGQTNGLYLSILGLRQDQASNLVLRSGAGNYNYPTMAGDWLVWQSTGGAAAGHLGAARLNTAVANAVPVAPAAPVQQLATITLPAMVGGAGHFVFWRQDTVPPSNSTLYGLDLLNNRRFTIANDLSDWTSFSSDGALVVWPDANFTRLEGFDLATNKQLVIRPLTSGQEVRAPAVDGKFVYFEAGGHIYQRAPRTGKESVLGTGQRPRASDGTVIWEHEEGRDQGAPFYSLHIYRSDKGERTVPTNGMVNGYVHYGASGENVFWYEEYGTNISVYNVINGGRREVAAQSLEDVLIHNTVLYWSSESWSDGGPSGTAILSYDLNSGRQTMALSAIDPVADLWAVLDPHTLVFTRGRNGNLTADVPLEVAH